MITNRKSFYIKLLSIGFFVFCVVYGHAQDEEIRQILITGFKIENVSAEKARIKYAVPDETPVEEEVEVGRKFPYGTLFETSASTEISARTPEGYNITIAPNTKLLSDAEQNSEEHRVIKGKVTVAKDLNEERSWWGKFKSKVKEKLDFFGGSSSEVQAAVEGTVFTIENTGDNLMIDLISGKVAINNRTKIVLDEKFIDLDSVPNRELILTEQTAYLTSKNQNYNKKLDGNSSKQLKTEKDLELFFKTEFANQKRVLTAGGANSSQGFKYMDQGQDSLGISNYESAMKTGELKRDRFIQAALIITEYYYRNNELKNRAIWLDAALHFIAIEHENNSQKYKYFRAIGEIEASKGFGSDLVVSKEYYAWAYTVKLMITGCLEHSNQNPAKWINEAKSLNDSLK